MDTSISNLTYLQEGRRIPFTQITPDEWLSLVRSLLIIHRPYRDYLPFVHDHREAVYSVCIQNQQSAIYSSTKPKKITYLPRNPPPCLDERTRLLPLVPIRPWRMYDHPANAKWDGDSLEDTYLLYGLGWVLLTRRMIRKPSQIAGTVISTESFTFEEIDESRLFEVLGDNSELWCTLYDAFQKLMHDAFTVKERHMLKMKSAYEKGKEVRDRIKFP